ncbi:MAG: hypothetical protein U1C49_00780 [Candidatus Andersenbacteria bacterium]|nr:hypothetical protein [Candidatus Andersenbacteria bacterium]
MNRGSLSYYREYLWRMMPWLLIASLAVAAVAYALAERSGPTYEVHYSYLVSLSERENPSEYTFDGYYALQATDLFAASLAKWATTPETVVAAYESAGLDLPGEDPKILARSVTAEKTAPQLIQVTVRDRDEEKASLLAKGLEEVMANNVDIYQQEGIPALKFRVVTSTPWEGKSAVSVPVITVATFVMTLLILVNGALLWKSLNQEEA